MSSKGTAATQSFGLPPCNALVFDVETMIAVFQVGERSRLDRVRQFEADTLALVKSLVVDRRQLLLELYKDALPQQFQSEEEKRLDKRRASICFDFQRLGKPDTEEQDIADHAALRLSARESPQWRHQYALKEEQRVKDMNTRIRLASKLFVSAKEEYDQHFRSLGRRYGSRDAGLRLQSNEPLLPRPPHICFKDPDTLYPLDNEVLEKDQENLV